MTSSFGSGGGAKPLPEVWHRPALKDEVEEEVDGRGNSGEKDGVDGPSDGPGGGDP